MCRCIFRRVLHYRVQLLPPKLEGKWGEVRDNAGERHSTTGPALFELAINSQVNFGQPADRYQESVLLLTYNNMESEVRSYSRHFPVTFDRAEGSYLYADDGRKFLDFFCAAGSLNYGHNPSQLVEPLVEYLRKNRVINSLDMRTTAKRDFLEAFAEIILKPRNMNYVVQFPGPTGTNAIEAALKLARMCTGRRHVAAFTNGFHGMTLGALAVTGNAENRAAAVTALADVIRVPYENYQSGCDGLALIEAMIDDPSSGIDAPAAFVVEVVQGEGGLRAASFNWLQRLQTLARRCGSLLIIDDIQAGCGRTGSFFSFEPAGIDPDIICLSKSIGGIGLPMSLVLFRRELDVWKPGQHNGTFRGNNLAFVAARAALDVFWRDSIFTDRIKVLSNSIESILQRFAMRYQSLGLEPRGRGLMRGLAFADPAKAASVAADCFDHGLICERCGPYDEVLKFLPALTIEESDLIAGFSKIEKSLERAAA